MQVFLQSVQVSKTRSTPMNPFKCINGMVHVTSLCLMEYWEVLPILFLSPATVKLSQSDRRMICGKVAQRECTTIVPRLRAVILLKYLSASHSLQIIIPRRRVGNCVSIHLLSARVALFQVTSTLHMWRKFACRPHPV